MSDPITPQQVTPTTIKRFIRNTARSISNDLVTATESLEDFLNSDPQENPQEAGEAAQIITRQIESGKANMLRLLTFMERLKTAELARTKESREEIAAAFAQLKAAMEASEATNALLS